MKVLIAEDDVETLEYLQSGLRELGHVTTATSAGREALFFAMSDEFDAIVLDRMLPEIDGLSALRSLRAAGVMTPVLVLTALARVEDRVEGLEAGADDYLVKPFAFSELMARLSAIVRRPAAVKAETVLTVGDVELNLLRREVRRAGVRVDLQPKEIQLLEVLMRNAGRVVTRTMLLERVWDFHFDPKTNIVETHVSRLRSKLNDGFDRDPIETVRGAGYMLNDNA